MSELLPCPFCGEPASAYWPGDHSTGYQAGCGNRDCEAEPHVWAKEGEAEAIEKWNTRTQPDPDPLLAQMAEALDGLIAVSEIAVMLHVMRMPHDANGPLPRAIEALSAYNERVKG